MNNIVYKYVPVNQQERWKSRILLNTLIKINVILVAIKHSLSLKKDNN
jgi:hypothetical protein